MKLLLALIVLGGCTVAEFKKCAKGCAKGVWGEERPNRHRRDPDSEMALGLVRQHLMFHELVHRKEREAKACQHLATQGVPCNRQMR